MDLAVSSLLLSSWSSSSSSLSSLLSSSSSSLSSSLELDGEVRQVIGLAGSIFPYHGAKHMMSRRPAGPIPRRRIPQSWGCKYCSCNAYLTNL